MNKQLSFVVSSESKIQLFCDKHYEKKTMLLVTAIVCY